jgi:heme exporter protein A
MGLLSHQSMLYDDLTLRENLVLAARLYGLPEPHAVADRALNHSGLSQRSSELPRKLSRGLLQRVAIARALLHSPRILLLDEPFTALDTAAHDQLRADLSARLEQGAGMIIVTHQLADVWSWSTRVAVLLQGRWAAEEPCTGPLESFASRYRVMTGE